VRLSDGSVVALTPERISVTSQGREVGSIAFHEVARQWLDQESLWGGHKQANDLTYVLRAGTDGELTAISDLTPLDDAALAVLTWRHAGSGLPIAAQYLVRVQVSPQPALVPLRRLVVSFTGDAYLYRPPGPRLFRAGTRLLLYIEPTTNMFDPGYRRAARSQVEEITANARTVRTLATFRAGLLPQGLVNGRWLVLLDSEFEGQRPAWVLDLATRKLRPLPHDWKSAKFFATRAFIPSADNQILLSRNIGTNPDGSGGHEQTFLVSIPSGKRRPLPGARMGHIWDGYVIAPDGHDGLSIYSAKTGKLVQWLRRD
jgi:hypothetical protein